MAFMDTLRDLNGLFFSLSKDLTKVEKGNKSAAQRIRVGTIQLERVARQFRKESIAVERKSLKQKNSIKYRLKCKKLKK